MIDIQIAGAGAGKTYGLAKIVLSRFNEIKPNNKIYALTYTNSAKAEIELEVSKQNNGFIPDNILIQTVHSFLLNEIIFPYSSFILKIPYKKSSRIYLGNNRGYAAKKIKDLKDAGEIHVDKVYLTAKQILDKENSKNKTKKQKLKVDKVLSILNTCIDSIFIDEVQDLDKDGLVAFKALGCNGVSMYMTGDPKQAIKYPKAFTGFLDENKRDENINYLPIDNSTRRVPTEVLVQSNRFCYPGQEQINVERVKGSINYIESNCVEFSAFIKSHIQSNDSLVYIDKKNGNYRTNKNKRYSFPSVIEEKIRLSNHKRDDELIVKAAYSEFYDEISLGYTKAIGNLLKKYDIPYDKTEYAQLCELCKLVEAKPSQYLIKSIEAVKGLEAKTCIFILTPNTYKYLIHEELNKTQIFNKEWKKLYVALTRTKKKLILVLDHELFPKHDIDVVKKKLEDISIDSYI